MPAFEWHSSAQIGSQPLGDIDKKDSELKQLLQCNKTRQDKRELLSVLVHTSTPSTFELDRRVRVWRPS